MVAVPNRYALLIAAALAGWQLAFPSSGKANCRDLLPGRSEAKGHAREITTRDLIELRDIGYPDPAVTGVSPLAVSPDGSSVAFVLSRADLDSNSYCSGLVVLPLRSGGNAQVLDWGGEFIPLSTYVRNLAVDVGLPAQITPVWARDGQRIAYLKRVHGITQIYVVSLAGGHASAITKKSSDVESLSQAEDGNLIFTTRPGMIAERAAIDAEGRSGWLYDERVAANAGPRPRITETGTQPEIAELDFRGGQPLNQSPRPAGVAATSSTGWVARTEAEGGSLLAQRRLSATSPGGRKFTCASGACLGGIAGTWWDSKGSELRFLRREGWNRELNAFYRWRPGAGAPQRVFASTDAIQNCVPVQDALVCTTENASQPRRVEVIDPSTGRRRVVFDPNPQFRSIVLGAVRRLHWRNDRGLEAWGDLVLPPNRDPRQKLPLVIVQYHSRGFLRGGTGDEYPIFLLAQHGFAVLSFERPRAVAEGMPGIHNDIDANAANERGWAERRSVQSALLRGIDVAVATENVDPKRIGITGLSDGATAVRFALINSDRFAAAAISSCCVEPKTAMTYGGIAWAKFNRAVGYPPASVDDPEFWRPMSLALNADHIRTPLLMQLADEEFVISLEAFEALREHQAPVELYVFPDEHHVKWQPVHRLAVYERNLDWFDFWLRCREDGSPAKSAQYQRWRELKILARQPATTCS
jgi:dipeptidyl aminopeptidase/acylaminoacyl peptidase